MELRLKAYINSHVKNKIKIVIIKTFILKQYICANTGNSVLNLLIGEVKTGELSKAFSLPNSTSLL